MIIWSCPVCKEWRISHRLFDDVYVDGSRVFCSRCMTPARLYALGADTLEELLTFIAQGIAVIQ